MPNDPCPLCNRRPVKRGKVLYGTPLCKKCYYGFANRRQIAYLIDSIVWQAMIIFPIGFVVGFLMVPASSTSTASDPVELFLTVMPYPMFLLFAMKDGFKGKSLGKATCGVMVLDNDTYQPIGFLASLKRNLVLIVPVLPLVIAFLLQKGYRVGDTWANSKVVWAKYRAHPVFTGQLACTNCHYDLRGCVSEACPECGCPIPQATRQAILDAGPPSLSPPATGPT